MVFIHILGKILKEKRLKMKLTLEELSEITKISITELSNLENGNIKEPSCVFLFRLSKVLKLNYEELLKYRYESYYRIKELLNA
ncbi:MAG: helix-turn-helix transcriptional regulator [Clostridia bacterium]|nr:helix-turn-helix transcriptional regulator [Clostridia bacterium]